MTEEDVIRYYMDEYHRLRVENAKLWQFIEHAMSNRFRHTDEIKSAAYKVFDEIRSTRLAKGQS